MENCSLPARRGRGNVSNPTIHELIAAIDSLPVDEQEAFADEINHRFLTSVGAGSEERPADSLSFPALARHVNYYALGIDDRDGKRGRLLPRWQAVTDRYQGFIAAFPSMKALIPAFNEDDLRQLCSFSTRHQGSRSPHLYLAIALFLIGEKDEGNLDGMKVLKIAVPSEETRFLERVRRELGHLLNRTSVASGLKAPFPDLPPPHRARDYPEVQASFACDTKWIERFQSFLRLYSVPTDGSLHLILYRAREGCPTDLVKSFIALYPGRNDPTRDQRPVYRSVHRYLPPSQDWGHPRLSLGWVIPLEQGLYILGGQKMDPERRGHRFGEAPRDPFRALDVLYFSWRSLESQLLYGLCLSANNNGTPFVTRVCARPTLIDHSERLELGEVSAADLAASLTDDYEREAQYAREAEFPEELVQRFHVKPTIQRRRELARIIAHHCNNSPAEPRAWDVAGPERRGRKKGIGKNAIAASLDELIGGGADAASPIDGRPMGFWGTILMGPITNHRS